MAGRKTRITPVTYSKRTLHCFVWPCLCCTRSIRQCPVEFTSDTRWQLCSNTRSNVLVIYFTVHNFWLAHLGYTDMFLQRDSVNTNSPDLSCRHTSSISASAAKMDPALPNVWCWWFYRQYARHSARIIWHEDVIKWEHFLLYWLFARGIHRLPMDSPHKGQWHRALVFSLNYAWTNGWETIETAVIWDAIALIITSLWMRCCPIWYTVRYFGSLFLNHSFIRLSDQSFAIIAHCIAQVSLRNWYWIIWKLRERHVWKTHKFVLNFVHMNTRNTTP